MSEGKNSSPKLLDREEAAEILGVSVRTIDRLIRKNAISSVRRARDVFIEEESVRKLHADGKVRRKKSPHEKADTDFPEVEKAVVIEQQRSSEESENVTAKVRGMAVEQHEGGIYKQLYEKKEEQAKELQHKLDRATYRVGTLEAQVKSMVPLMEYNKQRKETLLLAQANKNKEKSIKHLEKQVKLEQFVKKIYAVFLFIMTALTPLLLILRYFS